MNRHRQWLLDNLPRMIAEDRARLEQAKEVRMPTDVIAFLEVSLADTQRRLADVRAAVGG